MRSVIILCFVALAAARTTYEGYQVWRAEVDQTQHEKMLKLIAEYDLDVWAEGNNWVDIMVSPKHSRLVKEHLGKLGIRSAVKIPDIKTLVERDYAKIDARKANPRVDFDFEVYHPYEEIEAYLQAVAEEDPRANVSSIGTTYEGRDMWQLTIRQGEEAKPYIWFDCGIHAREWITPATCLWGINYLLTGYGTDADATYLLDNFDILFLPVNNPDGYVYTHTDSRLWRKNRVPNDGGCNGVDLNRNFDDHFGGPGTSDNSCSDTYRGASAASELEIQAVQNQIQSVAANTKALFSLHSYSQLWMYTPGWSHDIPAEVDELDAVSSAGVDAIAALYGTQYAYGTIGNTIYLASSTTVDYGYSAGIVHSYTLELRDEGDYGFLLPEDQIADNCREVWAGLIAGIKAIP